MKYENEITVEVEMDINSLLLMLKNKGFVISEEYDVNDIYMIDNKIDKSISSLDLLKSCVLLRTIKDYNGIVEKMTYKYKEYNSKKEIIKQGKIDCKVESVNNAKLLLEAINYSEFIRIFDHCIVVFNNEDEFIIQQVNGNHLYIEIEEDCHYIDKKYSSIDEMKDVFFKYGIIIKDNNFFVKKAEIEINKKYNLK